MKEETIWITDESQIKDVSDASLKRSLITPDGRGIRIKKAALDELIKRTFDEGYKKGLTYKE